MFYHNFLSLCAERRESPSGVAKKIGLSNAAANGWKNGKAPSDVNLAKLSNYFGVTIDYLLTGGETEKPATPEGDELSDEDIEIIELLRVASPAKKAALLALLKE